MKRTDTCVGRGVPLGKDGIYLNGQTIPLNVNKYDLYLAKKFGKHQKALATHLCIHREKGPIDEQVSNYFNLLLESSLLN